MRAFLLTLGVAVAVAGCTNSATRVQQQEIDSTEQLVAAINRQVPTMDGRRGSYTAGDMTATFAASYQNGKPAVISEERQSATYGPSRAAMHYSDGRLIRFYEEAHRRDGGRTDEVITALYFDGPRYIGGNRTVDGRPRQPDENDALSAQRQAEEARLRAETLLAQTPLGQPAAGSTVAVPGTMGGTAGMAAPPGGVTSSSPGAMSQQTSAGGRQVRFTCQDGSMFLANFSSDGTQVSIETPRNPPLVLPGLPTGSGFRYGSPNHVLEGRGNDATWTAPGRPTTACRAV